MKIGVALQAVAVSSHASGHFWDELLVYHQVALYNDPHHVHPMVTRCSVDVLCLVDRLMLTTDAALAPLHVPSSVSATLNDPHWYRAIEEYATLLSNHTWDLVCVTDHQRGHWQVIFLPQAHV